MSSRQERYTVVTEAYHVSNQCGSTTPQNDQWAELKPSPANDQNYDKRLLGLPGVFLTTSLWDGHPPDSSPYPTSGKPDAPHNRYAVSLDLFKDHEACYLPPTKTASNYTQVHIILLPPSNDRNKYFMQAGTKPLKWSSNEYLRRVDGEWMANDMNRGQKNVVNLFVWCRDSIPCRFYDAVARGKNGATPSSNRMLHLQLRNRLDTSTKSLDQTLVASCKRKNQSKFSVDIYRRLWLLNNSLLELEALLKSESYDSSIDDLNEDFTTLKVASSSQSSSQGIDE